MFTSSILIEMAIDAEENYQKAMAPIDRGYWNDIHNQAMLCAEWMDYAGTTELPFIGPFGNPSYQPGEKVRIKKFARIFSTNTKLTRTSTRIFNVTIHRYSKGFVYKDGWKIEVHQPIVYWVGSGGYYCWTDAANVERINY